MDLKPLFIQLAKDLEAKQQEANDLRDRLAEVMGKLGTGTFVQDLNDLTVYKIVKPNGTFISFKDIDYIRTAKVGENRGDLSKKAAEEAGFTVLKKS